MGLNENPTQPRYGRCSECDLLCVDRGAGFYHAGRNGRSDDSGHFANPIPDTITIFTPQDLLDTAHEASRHLGVAGELA